MTTTNYVVEFFDTLWNDVNYHICTNGSGTSNYSIYNSSFPPFDFYVNDETKDMVLEFAVAGIPKESIEFTVDGDYLILKIEKVEKPLRDGFRLVQQGIKSSSVRKKFYVPFSKYNLENIKLSMNEGILEVLIPAREELKVKRLTIK